MSCERFDRPQRPTGSTLTFYTLHSSEILESVLSECRPARMSGCTDAMPERSPSGLVATILNRRSLGPARHPGQREPHRRGLRCRHRVPRRRCEGSRCSSRRLDEERRTGVRHAAFTSKCCRPYPRRALVPTIGMVAQGDWEIHVPTVTLKCDLFHSQFPAMALCHVPGCRYPRRRPLSSLVAKSGLNAVSDRGLPNRVNFLDA